MQLSATLLGEFVSLAVVAERVSRLCVYIAMISAAR